MAFASNTHLVREAAVGVLRFLGTTRRMRNKRDLSV